LLTGGLKSSRFASIQASRFTGGWTFVAPGVSDDGDGGRVDVSMIERICAKGERQPRDGQGRVRLLGQHGTSRRFKERRFETADRIRTAIENRRSLRS
jgi:hypothetical protein